MNKEDFAELLTKALNEYLDENVTFNASISERAIEFDVMFENDEDIKLIIKDN